MLPNIGPIDSYTLMIIIGIAIAFTIFILYSRKNMERQYRLTVEIALCASILIGFGGALGVQKLIDLINQNFSRDFPMTFYGGLLFGVLTFILVFFLYIKKKYPKDASFEQICIIAPCCITAAHSLGRVGCFMAGCCYGKPTDSWIGIVFPGVGKVIPTNLMEAIFLAILTVVLVILAFKFNLKYNLSIYLMSYGIWRFIIEFFRGDDRGSYFLGMSPGQWFSILAIIGSIVLFFFFRHNSKKTKEVMVTNK